jgi:hypothetical protein
MIIKALYYSILLANNNYDKLEEKLRTERERPIKALFSLDLYFAKSDFSRWLNQFVEAYCSNVINHKMIDKYYKMTQLCYKSGLYSELIDSAKELLKSDFLNSEEEQQVLHIWGKAADGAGDQEEIKLCVKEIESKKYLDHPFLMWYKTYLQNNNT